MYQKYNKNRQSYNGHSRLKKQSNLDPNLFINKGQKERVIQNIKVKHKFDDFLIAEQIKRNISNKGYKTPTPIQEQVIPKVIEGRDIIGIANTGTGKTGAFLIPLISKTILKNDQKVLIIAPTRELAVQINEEFKIFSDHLKLSSVLLIGGANSSYQIKSLKKPHDFVIGTPGRIKDLKNQKKLNLAVYNNIVLDEVDRMMDMGFIHDMKFIISYLPTYRQSLFFSATFPKQIIPIANNFLKDPVTISVKTQETAANIDQDIIKIQGRNKVDVLHNLLTEEGFNKVLVFGRTKWGVEKLSKNLQTRGFKALAIHGNKNQNQRLKALDKFKREEIQILLATDVASRGLDIENVTHVINFDAPMSYEDYIHRIGRTGRAEKKGKAITFVD